MEQYCDIWLGRRVHWLLVARGCRLDAVKVERGANELVWAGEGEADSSAGDVGPVMVTVCICMTVTCLGTIPSTYAQTALAY